MVLIISSYRLVSFPLQRSHHIGRFGASTGHWRYKYRPYASILFWMNRFPRWLAFRARAVLLYLSASILGYSLLAFIGSSHSRETGGEQKYGVQEPHQSALFRRPGAFSCRNQSNDLVLSCRAAAVSCTHSVCKMKFGKLKLSCILLSGDE